MFRIKKAARKIPAAALDHVILSEHNISFQQNHLLRLEKISGVNRVKIYSAAETRSVKLRLVATRLQYLMNEFCNLLADGIINLQIDVSGLCH